MTNAPACTACPVCSSAIQSWRTKDTACGRFNLDVCTSCGFVFVNPRPTLAALTEFYSHLGYVGVNCQRAIPTKATVLAEENADPNSTIDAHRLVGTMAALLGQRAGGLGQFLDIGCGYGFFSVEAQRRGFEVTALDMATNKQKVMRELTGLEAVATSFEDYECPPSTFSGVLMSQVLEHVSDINFWIAKANRILTDGGILAVALPNFRNAIGLVRHEQGPYIIPPEHLNYFGAQSLSALLEKHGFKVEKVEWVSRLPRRIVAAKLPAALAPLAPLFHGLSRLVFGVFDALHLGLMLNIYARKLPPVKADASLA